MEILRATNIQFNCEVTEMSATDKESEYIAIYLQEE